MILTLLFLLQSATTPLAEWDGLPIPDAVGVPAARYIGCIGDPVEEAMTTGEPADPAARRALVEKARADCRDVRAEVTAEMDAKLAATPGWTDAAGRGARIARMLDAAEERVAFTVIDNEDFRALAERMMKCVNSGRKDCAENMPALKPRP